MTDREYRIARLKMLHEGGALVGTPEENLALHDRAQEDLYRLRKENDHAKQKV
jgi:hypothetical protein